VTTLALFAVGAVIIAGVQRKRRRLKAEVQQRIERTRLAGELKIWRVHEDEDFADTVDLADLRRREIYLVIADDDSLVVVPAFDRSTVIIARIHSFESLVSDGLSKKVSFQLASERNHRLMYESGGEMREAATLTLCDNDFIELDGRWRLRYSNNRLRTRAEFESAEVGGNNDFK
jgi:hypothetical protein